MNDRILPCKKSLRNLFNFDAKIKAEMVFAIFDQFEVTEVFLESTSTVICSSFEVKNCTFFNVL